MHRPEQTHQLSLQLGPHTSNGHQNPTQFPVSTPKDTIPNTSAHSDNSEHPPQTHPHPGWQTRRPTYTMPPVQNLRPLCQELPHDLPDPGHVCGRPTGMAGTPDGHSGRCRRPRQVTGNYRRWDTDDSGRGRGGFSDNQRVNTTPPLTSNNPFACLSVEPIETDHTFETIVVPPPKANPPMLKR